MTYICVGLAAARDGRLLVGGGRSRFLHVWALETRSLLRVLELPCRTITAVTQLEFLPDAFDAGANQVTRHYPGWLSALGW